MNRKIIIVSIIFICFITLCNRTKLFLKEDSVLEMTQISPTLTTLEEDKSEMEFSSMEKAYYSKYVELAKIYGTYSLYDYYSVKSTYSGRSYLGGVCAVNLLDFNRDGVQDLFVVYSNSQMDKIIDDGFNLEIYDIPAKDTYEVEIWTYIDRRLSQILHESSVSLCYTYPNDKSDFSLNYYQNFITVYENKNGFPVIQIYDESEEGRKYTNIYYSDGQVIRDKLIYNGDTIQMNGVKVTENIWSKNVAGYNKILLCTFLADSHQSSTSLFEGYNIDYNNTLLQTERVIRYLSEEDRSPTMTKFYNQVDIRNPLMLLAHHFIAAIAACQKGLVPLLTQVSPHPRLFLYEIEAGDFPDEVKKEEYISLYLQALECANRVRVGSDFTENHYFNVYDINQDGIPELILYESTIGAGTHYHFYTVINGELVNCGNYECAQLYVNGKGGLIAYYTRMNGYQIDKITLEEDVILITNIANGYIQDYYPELEEFGYDNYKSLTFCPPAIPLAFYTYNQSYN